MHDARAWLRRFRLGTFGRRRDQSLYELAPEADDLVSAHVAADHAVGQPGLERLIDDAALVGEIRFAQSHEIAERHLPRDAASRRVQYPNDCAVLCRLGCDLDFPHSLATVTAVLFEDAWSRRPQALRKLFAKRFD